MAKSKAEDKKWIIVQNADKANWQFHFEKDPTKGTVESNKVGGALYTNKQQADEDCAELVTLDPKGGYAVCPIDYGKTSIKH